jgi:hypothetical protein
MDKADMLARLRESVHEPYQLGSRSEGTRMIPINHDHSIVVDAGPVKFLVEPRILDDNAVGMVGAGPSQSAIQSQSPDGPLFDDNGPTVHVMGGEDGLEHLRFDCFVNKPHYHYVRYRENQLVTVRLDQYAEGDPVDWTMDHLRRRLADMLDYAGASDLSQGVRDHQPDVLAALDEVDSLVRTARREMSPAGAVG